MSKEHSSTNSNRMFFIEGLRGLAALYVVLGHLCSMADTQVPQGRPSLAPIWAQWLMKPFWYGHLAVAAFIVISGFCLQMSIFGLEGEKKLDWKRFFFRRAKRILPPYYAALILSIGIAWWVTTPLAAQYGLPFSQYVPLDDRGIWSHFLLVHNWDASSMYKINGVMWSIGTEAQLYVIFPLLLLSIRKIGRLNSVVFLGLLATALLVMEPSALKFRPWYLPLFVLGMASCSLAYRPPKLKSLGKEAIGVALLGMVGTLALIQVSPMMPVTDVAIGVTLAATLYACATYPKAKVSRMLGARPLMALGTVSYSLYLMHHPIQQVLFMFKPAWAVGEVGVLTYLGLIGLPFILLGSFAFWFLFERPFQMRLLYSSRNRSYRSEGTTVPFSDESFVVSTLPAYAPEAPAWARERVEEPVSDAVGSKERVAH